MKGPRAAAGPPSRLFLTLIPAIALALCLVVPRSVLAQRNYNEIYCGQENCYDVLGVEQAASMREIKKKFRSLSKTVHPDRNRHPDAEKQFARIGKAYETLTDKDSRENYDYMLAHPEEYYSNMYRYYKHRATPKVNVTPIVVVLVSLVSMAQYFDKRNRRASLLNWMMQDKAYIRRGKEMIEDRGISYQKLKKYERALKMKEMMVIIIGEERENLHLARVSYEDVLWYWILISPYTLFMYLKWQCDWYVKYSINKKEYSPEDIEYLTRKSLGLSQSAWLFQDKWMRDEAIEKEVWKNKDNLRMYKKKIENRELEDFKARFPNRYKQYKRWKKSRGKMDVGAGDMD